MTTHLIQLMPDERRLMSWAAEHKFLRGSDMSYGLHGILNAAFGGMAPRTYVWLDSLKGHRRPHILAYSEHNAEALKEQAGFFGEPQAMEALGVETMASKAMPAFRPGLRLGFEVVTRPVVRSSRSKSGGKGSSEHDVYLHARKNALQDGRDADGLDRDGLYCEWLEGRLAEQGVDVQSIRVVGRREIGVSRRARPKESNRSYLREVRGQEIRYEGVIEVVDVDAFTAALPQGVGRHRVFGYGMLVLRPAPAASLAA